MAIESWSPWFCVLPDPDGRGPPETVDRSADFDFDRTALDDLKQVPGVLQQSIALGRIGHQRGPG